ncbi:MAG: efflux RND transporter periplasmic adaptor subunit [Clostridiales Family XIII bacterium]|jgi:RND family efflux transporter MFP subunit|nr:efflux RND transporter periplasmic adaptor subunit [Clostridiales Family XIII bacterium]
MGNKGGDTHANSKVNSNSNKNLSLPTGEATQINNGVQNNNIPANTGFQAAPAGAPFPEYRRRGMNGVLKFIIFILITGVFCYAAYNLVVSRMEPIEPEPEVPVNVRVAAAAYNDISLDSVITGRIEAVDEVSVLPKMAGAVTNVYVELGSRVSAGTILFSLDSTQLAVNLNQAKTSLDSASVIYERMGRLLDEGVIPLQNYEQAQVSYVLAYETYAAAQDAYNNAVVTSPISGYVTSVNVSSGTLATQAVPAVTIANIDRLVINAGLSEKMINKVALGDTVNVLVKSASEESVQGRITAISPAPVTGSLTYPIKISLENSDSRIKPGMFAEVMLAVDTSSGVLTIPSKAVMIKSGRRVVAALDADNRVRLVDVVIGIDDGAFVEIKEGLNIGDIVVTDGQTYIDESSAVNIVE